jgi:DNA polymerase-3 subunit epsilon
LPEAPGVYFFFGDNALPIYIGKARNLRERVAAHFSSDWRSETDLRLSQEIRRIEFEETAGEFGALLREATLVKSLLPAHNRRCVARRKLACS